MEATKRSSFPQVQRRNIEIRRRFTPSGRTVKFMWGSLKGRQDKPGKGRAEAALDGRIEGKLGGHPRPRAFPAPLETAPYRTARASKRTLAARVSERHPRAPASGRCYGQWQPHDSRGEEKKTQ